MKDNDITYSVASASEQKLNNNKTKSHDDAFYASDGSFSYRPAFCRASQLVNRGQARF